MPISQHPIQRIALVFLLGLSMAGAGFWLSRLSDVPVPKREPGSPREQDWTARRGQLLAELLPLVDAEAERNRQAIAQAEQRLGELFGQYERGVPRFVGDLTSLGTRFQLTQAMLRDWWSDSNEARRITTELFGKHVVSAERLEKDLGALVQQVAMDMEASRNTMLAEAVARLRTAEFPIPALGSSASNFSATFQHQAERLIERRAHESPMNLALAIGTGALAQQAAQGVVGMAARVTCARLATLAASGGGATAASALGGGAGGSAVPGVGTAIGFASGIIAGFAVDCWMQSRFEEEVARESRMVLVQVQEAIWTQPEMGLHKQFAASLEAVRESHRETLAMIVEGGSL